MAEEIGFKLSVDAGNSEKTVKSFKQELKEARDNVVEMTRKFGEVSPEAINAARALSGLREEMADINSLTTAITDEKRFTAFAGFGSSIAGGFAAAQGAIALTTGESENLQKALVKVQSAMAISQGLAQVADLGKQYKFAKAALMEFTIVQKINSAATAAASVIQKLFAGAVDTTSLSFKVLKGAIIATGIGALVVVIGYLINNFDKVKQVVFNLIPGLSKVADFIGALVDKVTDFVGVTSDATRETDKLRAAIESQNDAHDKQIQLLEASGATAKEVRAAKAKMYEDEIQNLTKVTAANKKWTDEDLKRARDLQFQKQLLNLEQAKEDKDAATEAAKKADENHKKAVEDAKSRAKEVAAAKQKEADAEKKLQDDIRQALEDSREKQVTSLQKQHDFEIKLLQAQGKETTAIRAQQIDDEIALMQQLGGKQLEKIQALEEEKVIAAAAAKKAAEDKVKEEEKKQQEQIKQVQDQLNSDAEAAKADGVQKDLDAIQAKYDAMRALVGGNEKMLTEINEAEAQARSEATKKWDDITAENKRQNLAKVGSLLSGFSKLVGENTVIGKGLAIASTTIDTYQAASAAIKATAGLPFVGTAMGIANAALIIGNGLMNVKKIVATKVPNVSDSSSAAMPATSAAANGSPAVNSTPSMDGIQSTLVQQTKQLTEGKDALKAYVVESEVTQKQERAKAITQTANF